MGPRHTEASRMSDFFGRDGAVARISAHRLGLVLAVVTGGWHLVWSALVAVGGAQAVIDVIFWLHFIDPPYRVGPFGAGRAVLLVGATTMLGYVLGRVIAAAWNAVRSA